MSNKGAVITVGNKPQNYRISEIFAVIKHLRCIAENGYPHGVGFDPEYNEEAWVEWMYQESDRLQAILNSVEA